MRRETTASVLAALFLLLAASSEPLLAGSGGSAYSIFGVGDIRYSTGVRSAGMGYTGLGISGAGYLNGFAPATWARLDRARLEASLLYEGYQSTDGTHNRYLSRADFNGAMLAIPVSAPSGIVLVAGIIPFSTVNYDAYTRGEFLSAQDTMSYTVHHIGTGGITRGMLGLTYAPSQSLAFGFSTDILFGSIDAEEDQLPASSVFTGGAVTGRVTANGVTFSLGTLYTGLGDLVPSLRGLSLGAVVTSRGGLSSRDQTTYRFTSSETSSERDTSAEVTRRSTFPLAFGVGLGYLAGERMLFAVDYYRQLWSQATLNDLPAASLRDSYRLGIGFERLPSRDRYASFAQLIAYRLGAYSHSTYYQPNGEPINEWGITAGGGIPFSGETRMNFAFEYARRGTLNAGLIQDTIFRFSVSLNISALWFVQYPED